MKRDDASGAGPGESLDDLLDRLVAEYSDRVADGSSPRRDEFLGRAPAHARPGLERCLKMIDAGRARAPSAARPLTPGLELGRYRLTRELGRGGMAHVWLARDLELERPVALKLLRPGLALEDRHVDRFRREALAVARLRHPNIVQIHDVGEGLGYHYLAMEFVEGPSLATVLAALPRGERSWTSDELAVAAGIPALSSRGATYEQAVATLLAPVAAALHAAHELGLVHRDVKPSNILLRSDGTAVVADFGLAKADEDPALSMTGETLGTPYYMSPEQAWLTDVRVDHRTDVYSLGVTLYEALSGERPYDGATVLEVFEAIKTKVPAPLRQVARRSSRDAAAVTRRCMARLPEDRYPTADELRSDLRALAAGQPTRAREREGGPLRRAWLGLRLMTSGQPYEYRSATTFLGLPLVHVHSGRRYPGQRMRVAKGWLAFGDVALGGIALGGLAFGGLTAGGISAGVLGAWGGVAVAGLLSFGGLSIGGAAMGGLALGGLTVGGCAIGYSAVGGWARGVYATGGNATGRYVLSDERRDPEAVEWFESTLPGWFDWLTGG